MSTRLLTERARYSLARELAHKSLTAWQVLRIGAVVAFLALLIAEPDHRIARAVFKASIALLNLILHAN